MNTRTIAILIGGLGIVACGDRAASDEEVTRIDASDVEAETREAVSTTVRYVDQRKDDVVEAAEQQMSTMKAQILALKQDIVAAGDDAQTRLDNRVKILEQRWKRAQSEMSAMKSASGDAWQDMTKGFDAAMTELEGAYSDAVAEFNDASKSTATQKQS